MRIQLNAFFDWIRISFVKYIIAWPQLHIKVPEIVNQNSSNADNEANKCSGHFIDRYIHVFTATFSQSGIDTPIKEAVIRTSISYITYLWGRNVPGKRKPSRGRFAANVRRPCWHLHLQQAQVFAWPATQILKSRTMRPRFRILTHALKKARKKPRWVLASIS